MKRHSMTFTLAGAALLAFLLLNNVSLHPVMARDYQDPNYQISSSNTSNDYGSWIRWSVTTNQPFHATITAGSPYFFTYQMNTYLNGCSIQQTGCAWWLQGIVEAQVTQNPSGPGVWIIDSFEQGWQGSYTGENFCHLSPSPNLNVNYTGYVVLQQTTLTDSSDITYLLSISDNTGTVLYAQSNPCVLPTSPPNPNSFGPVNFFTRLEGVVVGPNVGSPDVSFSPLSSTIFSPFYLDLISNYNLMSSSSLGTQTVETSNLYQNAGQAYGQSYGSQYLYTVIGSEVTGTGA